jgi:hypothetical protein
MNTIIIKSNEIKSNEIEAAMKEIASDPKLFEKALRIADNRSWGVADAIEAIASHIVINDEDYVLEMDSWKK